MSDTRDQQTRPVRTQDEVAAILGCHRSNVGQAEKRAFRKLRAAIESECSERGLSIRQWIGEAT